MALLILVSGGNNSLKVHTVVEICCRSFANGFSSLPAWNVINQWHFCSTGFMLLYWPHFLSLIFPFKVIESWINGRVSDRAHKIGSLTFRCIWLFKSGYLHCSFFTCYLEAYYSHRFFSLVTICRGLHGCESRTPLGLKYDTLGDQNSQVCTSGWHFFETSCDVYKMHTLTCDNRGKSSKAKPRLYRFQKNPFEEIVSLLKWKFKIISNLKIWMNLQVDGNIHSGVSQWKGQTQLEL